MTDGENEEVTFPGWFPRSVAHWIAEGWSHPEHIAGRGIIMGLAYAPFMRGLWDELKRQKPDGKFVHPAQIKPLEIILGDAPKDPVERQNAAYTILFKHLLWLVNNVPHAATKDAAMKRRAELIERANFLQKEATDTEAIDILIPGVDWQHVARGMRQKAIILTGAASALPTYRLIVSSSRSNMTGLAVASQLSGFLHNGFGSHFYGLTADLASSLSFESVTKEQVKEVVRKHPTSVDYKMPRITTSTV